MEYSTAWIPFVIFIILTGFVVVNLIIAVICDAIQVMGGVGNNADSYTDGNRPNYVSLNSTKDGFESNVEGIGMSSSQQYSTTSTTTTVQRIEELQKQLDDLVVAQDQMRRIIELLTARANRAKIKATQRTKDGKVWQSDTDRDKSE